MHSCAKWRWGRVLQRLPLLVVLTAIPAEQAAMAAEPAEDDVIARKVAVIELSRSIRSYTVGILATADCLVREGRLSRREADQAVPIQLREMGISPHVVNNPQVVITRPQLLALMDASCRLGPASIDQARTLAEQEL